MENKVFPTKGNLIASKKSLALAGWAMICWTANGTC